MSAFLGLDCGGTKTRWRWRPDGVRPGGEGPGVQPATQGVAAAAARLVELLRTASPQLDAAAAVCAIAGAGDPVIRTELVAALGRAGVRLPVAIVGDVLAAAAGALDQGPGVLVWSGTGSFAVARAADGTLHRTGGRGHLLGDQGSAYDLVRRAAAAVVLAADGLGEPTALTELLTAACGAPSPQHLGGVLQRREPGAVAALLPTVLECAARGDGAADRVLDEGLEALAMVANAAVRQAGLGWTGPDGRALPVVVGGGVLSGSDALRERLAQRLQAFGAAAPTVAAGDCAALGAAALAQAWHEREDPWRTQVEHGAL
ncbi:MAG: N-acetylglucosamine kinase [Planctomycetota bacterium]